MSYLTEAVGKIGDMFSAGQYGALIIVIACAYIAYKGAQKVFGIIAGVIACFAAIYFVAPDFFPELLRMLYEAFNALCNMAGQLATGS